MQVAMDWLGSEGVSRMGTGLKEKQEFDEWKNYTTVSFRKDAEIDYHNYRTDHDTDWATWLIIEGQPWFVCCIVGLLTAISGALIEHVVDFFGSLRFGLCHGPFPEGVNGEQCETGYWDGGAKDYYVKYLNYIVVSTLLAFTSAFLTFKFAPMARGSGIPEIKTILGGFVMPEVLEANTLCIKIVGLGLSVAAGLSCGKEGPLVHIACCWCNIVCNCIPRFRKNEGKKRELLSCACASGVAVAFGAPLGGVLFSLEEASTFFPTRTMIKAFTGGAVAAWMLEICHTDPKTGVGYLTMFGATYQVGPSLIEYLFFIFMGIVGGMIGALFVHYNIRVSKFRAPGTPWRKKVLTYVEVAAIAFCTAVTSFPLLWTRVISNATIRALFHNCAHVLEENADPKTFMLDLCDSEAKTSPSTDLWIMAMLAVSAFLRYAQMTFTFGCGAPSGLFIPSLYTGAALGRILGVVVYIANKQCENGCFAPNIYPGVYAMMGAAAVLGGVCRVTVSLVVIMFELTSGLQLVVPFMIVCLLAKYSGDLFTPGIYDYCITIRKYPFLHEPDDVMFHTKAMDLLDEDVTTLTPEPGTVFGFQQFLQSAKYGGYPVVNPERRIEPMLGGRAVTFAEMQRMLASHWATLPEEEREESQQEHWNTLEATEESGLLLGYIFTEIVKDYINKQCKANVMINNQTKIVMGKFLPEPPPPGVFDLCADQEMRLVDENIVTVTPETPADMVHKIFRQLGNKVILVKKEGKCYGLITKKSFIRHMEEQHAIADEHEEKHEAINALKEAPKNKNRRQSTLKQAL